MNKKLRPDPAESNGRVNPQPVPPAMAAPGAEEAGPAAGSPVQAELDELMDRLRRTTADYQNYQKRVVKEMADARRYANAELVKELLPVIDSLDRAMETKVEPATSAVLAGVRITHEHLMALLRKHGVTVIDALGRPFDPQLHEAMMQQPSGEAPPMTVLTELSKGYRMHDRVLRPARVIVSSSPAEKSEKG